MIHEEARAANPDFGSLVADEAAYLALRSLRDRALKPLVTILETVGTTPAAVSLAGVALALALGPALATAPALALALFVAALGCDALDGALARRLGCASVRGKTLDQACDTATFCAVLLALVSTGHAAAAPAAFAGVATVALLVAAWTYHRRRDGQLAPRGGFFAHSPKGLVYAAFVALVVADLDLVEPAVLAAGAASVLFTCGFGIALLRLRIGSPRVGRNGRNAH